MFPQDAQKVCPARPQRVKARGVPLWYVESLSDARTKLADFFSILLGKSCDVRLRDTPIPNPISPDVRLRLFHEGDEEIGGDWEVDLWPNFFVIRSNLNISSGGSCRVVGMRVIDHLQVESFISNVFLRNGKILHIHDKGNLGALGW
jgi:hypothetical protein